MRPTWPRIVVPVPVALWAAVGAGHLAALAAPIPAHLETMARALALAAGVLSLAAGAASGRDGYAPRVGGWRRALARAEPVKGMLAAVFAGVALAGEVDRVARPLPVHPEGTQVALEGKVLDTTAVDDEPATIALEARRVRVGETEAACRARVLLRWRDGAIPPRWILPGLWLRVEGRYRPPEDARNPGTSAPGSWLERAGIAGVVTVDPLSPAAPPDPPERGGAWTASLRDRLARTLAASLSGPVAGLARGMLLGDRSALDPAVQRSFRSGGTVHILSISGLHVCIIAGFLALLASACRLSAGSALALELGALWGYIVLVGAPASAVRSAILWTSIRSGRLLGQAVRPFAAWGTAGLLLHLLDPASVSDPGFQLSFLAVLGLGSAGMLSRLNLRAPAWSGVGGNRGARLAAGTWSLFVQSAGATLGTAGLQSRLFGAIPLVGLVLNLAVIPLCTLFMAEAILALAVAPLGISLLSSAAAGAADASGLLLLAVNAWGADLLSAWTIHHLPPPIAVIGAALALVAAWGRGEAARYGQPSRVSAACWSAVALALAAAVPLAPAWPGPDASTAAAVVLSLDVGQGDATWIGLPGGGSILVDAGPADESRDAGEREVEPALRAEGRGPIDVAILSHAHADHYGGLPWLAERSWIRRLFENGGDSSGAWRAGIEAGLKRRGAAWERVLRDTIITSLDAAALLTLLRGAASGSENDRSIAASLRMGGNAILLAGDLEAEGERALLPRLSPVEVLKAPHHGSRTSSGAAWVSRLRPRVVLVSCGERNRFGHPDAAVVDRYRRSGAIVLRTDREGAIRVTLTGNGAWISTRRKPAPVLVPWDRADPVTPLWDNH